MDILKPKMSVFLIMDLIKKKRVPKSKYLREAVLRISTDEKGVQRKVVFKITKDKNRTRYFNVNKGIWKEWNKCYQKAGVKSDFRRFEELNYELNRLSLITVRGEFVNELPLTLIPKDRGKIFLLQGDEGVADALYVCIKKCRRWLWIKKK